MAIHCTFFPPECSSCTWRDHITWLHPETPTGVSLIMMPTYAYINDVSGIAGVTNAYNHVPAGSASSFVANSCCKDASRESKGTALPDGMY